MQSIGNTWTASANVAAAQDKTAVHSVPLLATVSTISIWPAKDLEDEGYLSIIALSTSMDNELLDQSLNLLVVGLLLP